MKKILLVVTMMLAMFTMAAALVENHVPAAAFMHIKLQPASLLEKSDWNGQDIQAIFDKLPASSEQIKALMANPTTTGIDLNSPVYISALPGDKKNKPGVVAVAALKSADQFATFIKGVFPDAKLEDHGGMFSSKYHTVTPGNDGLFAYNNELLVAINDIALEQGVEAKDILKMSASKSLAGLTAGKQLASATGELAFLMNLRHMPNLDDTIEKLSMLKGSSLDVSLLAQEDYFILGNLVFENGKATFDVQTIPGPKMSKNMNQFMSFYKKGISNDILKWVSPGSACAYIGFSIDIPAILKHLEEVASKDAELKQKMDQQYQSLAVMGLQKQQIQGMLTGEIAFTWQPTYWVAAIGTKEPAALQQLLNMGAMFGVVHQNGIYSFNPSQMMNQGKKDGNGYYATINQGVFLISNNQKLVTDAAAGTAPAVTTTNSKLTQAISNNYSIMWVNFETLASSLADNVKAEKLTEKLPFKEATLSSQRLSGKLELTFKDSGVNALKQMLLMAKDID